MTVATASALDLDPAAFETRTVAMETPRQVPAAPERVAATAAQSATPLEPAVIHGVQQRLRVMGFYRGAADGIWGPVTQNALIEFQKSRGLDATGDLTPATASVMGLNPNNLSRSVTTGYRP